MLTQFYNWWFHLCRMIQSIYYLIFKCFNFQIYEEVALELQMKVLHLSIFTRTKTCNNWLLVCQLATGSQQLTNSFPTTIYLKSEQLTRTLCLLHFISILQRSQQQKPQAECQSKFSRMFSVWSYDPYLQTSLKE